MQKRSKYEILTECIPLPEDFPCETSGIFVTSNRHPAGTAYPAAADRQDEAPALAERQDHSGNRECALFLSQEEKVNADRRPKTSTGFIGWIILFSISGNRMPCGCRLPDHLRILARS